MARSQYKYGVSKEKKVADLLRKKGAGVNISPGSRGAADLKVTFSTGTKWNIQVKSSRSSKPATMSAKDRGRLKQGAIKSAATAVIANVTPKGIEYRSARDGRKLTPPRRSK